MPSWERLSYCFFDEKTRNPSIFSGLVPLLTTAGASLYPAGREGIFLLVEQDEPERERDSGWGVTFPISERSDPEPSQFHAPLGVYAIELIRSRSDTICNPLPSAHATHRVPSIFLEAE